MPSQKPTIEKSQQNKPAAARPENETERLQREVSSLQGQLQELGSQLRQAQMANQALTQTVQHSAAARIEAEARLAEARAEVEQAHTHMINEIEEVRVRLQREIDELRSTVGQPVRRRMPATRNAINHKFSIGGQEGYINAGLFEDGKLGEVFIEIQKEGSTVGGMMDTIAILTSMALQYGVPLEMMIKKFSYQRYEPAGFTPNTDIPMAYSITDYVFRWLGCVFVPGFAEGIKQRNAEAAGEMSHAALVG